MDKQKTFFDRSFRTHKYFDVKKCLVAQQTAVIATTRHRNNWMQLSGISVFELAKQCNNFVVI